MVFIPKLSMCFSLHLIYCQKTVHLYKNILVSEMTNCLEYILITSKLSSLWMKIKIYLLTIECTRIWRCKYLLREKTLSQTLQGCRPSACCSKCILRCDGRRKPRSHTGHLWGFSPRCRIMWYLRAKHITDPSSQQISEISLMKILHAERR